MIPTDVHTLIEGYLYPNDRVNYSLACKAFNERLRKTNLLYRDLKIDILSALKASDTPELKDLQGVEKIKEYKSQFPYLHVIEVIALFGEMIIEGQKSFTQEDIERTIRIQKKLTVSFQVAVQILRASFAHHALTEEVFTHYWQKFKITNFFHSKEGFRTIPLAIFKTFCDHAKKGEGPIEFFHGWRLEEAHCLHLIELMKHRKIEIMNIQYYNVSNDTRYIIHNR